MYNKCDWMWSCKETPCPFGMFDPPGHTPGKILDLQ